MAAASRRRTPTNRKMATCRPTKCKFIRSLLLPSLACCLFVAVSAANANPSQKCAHKKEGCDVVCLAVRLYGEKKNSTKLPVVKKVATEIDTNVTLVQESAVRCEAATVDAFHTPELSYLSISSISSISSIYLSRLSIYLSISFAGEFCSYGESTERSKI